jgi:hypothetical protein
MVEHGHGHAVIEGVRVHRRRIVLRCPSDRRRLRLGRRGKAQRRDRRKEEFPPHHDNPTIRYATMRIDLNTIRGVCQTL